MKEVTVTHHFMQHLELHLPLDSIHFLVSPNVTVNHDDSMEYIITTLEVLIGHNDLVGLAVRQEVMMGTWWSLLKETWHTFL